VVSRHLKTKIKTWELKHWLYFLHRSTQQWISAATIQWGSAGSKLTVMYMDGTMICHHIQTWHYDDVKTKTSVAKNKTSGLKTKTRTSVFKAKTKTTVAKTKPNTAQKWSRAASRARPRHKDNNTGAMCRSITGQIAGGHKTLSDLSWSAVSFVVDLCVLFHCSELP